MGKEKDKIEALINKGEKYIGVYQGFVTALDGDSVVGAIKYFYSHYNSVLSILMDVDNIKIYKGKENKQPDCRGYYNYSYYDEDGQIIFNVDELTEPIVKIKSSPINKSSEHGYIDRSGHFYKCGFECHYRLACELFLSGTIEKPQQYREGLADQYLYDMGWIRISDKRIIVHFNINPSLDQKRTLIKYMEIVGDENYEYNNDIMSKLEIEKELNN